MWLITLVQFLFASLFAGLGQHFIAYLIDVGYSPNVAARVLSMLFMFTTIGSLISGPMADRVNARLATAATWFVTAIAVFALLGAAHFSALMVYAVLIGAVGGAFGVLLPLLMLESLGIKRFGSLMGIAGVLSTLGYAAGPVVTGWIHDRTTATSPRYGCSSAYLSYASSHAWRAARCRACWMSARAKPREVRAS